MGDERRLARARTFDQIAELYDRARPYYREEMFDDLPSIQRLEETLAGYPGALLLVSHDDALVRRVTETRWAIVDERIHVVAEREDHV